MSLAGETTPKWPREAIRLLHAWKRQVGINILNHHKEALYYKRRFYIMGGIATVLGTILTGIGIAFAKDPIRWLTITTDICVAIITALTGLITLLGDGERSNKHHEASNRYRALELLISNILAIPASVRGNPKDILTNLCQQYDDIVSSSPILSRIEPLNQPLTRGDNREDIETGNQPIPPLDMDGISWGSNDFSDRIRMQGQIENDRCAIANRNMRYNIFAYECERLGGGQNEEL